MTKPCGHYCPGCFVVQCPKMKELVEENEELKSLLACDGVSGE